MREFTNNLKKGDRVMVAEDNRVGTVARDPGEKNRLTYVLFTGYDRAKGMDVTELRFIPPGEDAAENVAPYDGELPEAEVQAVSVPASKARGVIEVLRNQKAQYERELNGMNNEARRIRTELDRLDRAIDVLEGKP